MVLFLFFNINTLKNKNSENITSNGVFKNEVMLWYQVKHTIKGREQEMEERRETQCKTSWERLKN